MFDLVETCGACPEQYDVYLDGTQVAYMRLRHGTFCVTSGGETIYTAYPDGDGMFTMDERQGYLNAACKAIGEWLERKAEAEAEKVEPNLYRVVTRSDAEGDADR